MSNVTKLSGDSKINLRIIWLVVVVGFPLGIFTMFIQVPPSCGCGDSSKVTIESFITTQKAYFLEKSVFAQSYSLLELGEKDTPKATNHYRYSVEMNQDRSFIYATPVKELPTDLFQLGLTKKGFHSLVGAVAYKQENKTTVSIMCRSEKPTLAQPPKPVFQQNHFSCPIGFKTIY
ncbi:type IV pilin-like G/H family protein [Nostoc sp. FACHB-190]|uniref:type IV pilin-like G/H family protein n=1 Tax=Nostoc sp. FACHB-190 TaxID=2692838 RepID=UPI0016846279|nr:type IV pilin-like G/H family protein [Nostoc sp. FACHB-190]MBD2303798.1 hypothetical protein [Nostoc sp. FACHB-190]